MDARYEARQATIEDLRELAALFNEYRMYYGQAPDEERARRFLFERFEHRESIMFLARDRTDNRAVGFTQLYPAFSSISMKRSLILNDLFVIEACRGQGAGQLLLDAAKAYARSIGAKGLELETMISNEQAQRLYERNGYEKETDFYRYFLRTEG